ncbi:MAG: putative Na+/H+ antiporter [Desulfobacterales bacterium]|jgi:hypothetical protein
MTEPINRNTTITFLSMLMPGFTDGLKYTVVTRAAAGNDLTARANAPNPAGLNLLKKAYSKD